MITTLLHLYLIHVFTGQRLKIRFYSVAAAVVVIFFKVFMFSFLADSFLFFAVAWFCVFVLTTVFTEGNIRRNLELSFFIALINAMSYYIGAGILLFVTQRFNLEEVLNLSLIGQTNIPHIAITASILLLFGIFSEHIPLRFLYEKEEKDISGIFFILSINLVIQIMYFIPVSQGTKLILFVMINVFVMVFYIKNKQLNIDKAKVRKEIEEKELIITELSQYIHTIEELVDQFKEFRHDCKNMLLGTGIEGSKIDEMVGQVESELKRNTNYDIFLSLKEIRYSSLKSLLYYYIMNGLKNGIDIKLNVIGNVKDLKLPNIAFSRVLGIIFENALEASANSVEKKIEVYIEAPEKYLNIVIGNTYRDPIGDVEELFKKGFSTKGEDRGTGLYNLRSIIRQNSIFQLETYINEGLFIQDLSVELQKA
jgi:two-component system sensor histidine kinase AgrC